MKTKYHGVIATLIRETEQAVCVNATHADYGVFPGLWIPKSVILEESVDEIEESGDGDELEIFVAAWWLRRNFSDNPNGR